MNPSILPSNCRCSIVKNSHLICNVGRHWKYYLNKCISECLDGNTKSSFPNQKCKMAIESKNVPLLRRSVRLLGWWMWQMHIHGLFQSSGPSSSEDPILCRIFRTMELTHPRTCLLVFFRKKPHNHCQASVRPNSVEGLHISFGLWMAPFI